MPERHRDIILTAEQRRVATDVLAGFNANQPSIALETMLAAIRAANPRCAAESGSAGPGRCLYVEHQVGAHFDGLFSWHS